MSAINELRQIVRPATRLGLLIGGALGAGFLVTLAVSETPLHAYWILLTGVIPDIRWSEADGWSVYRLVRFGGVLQDATTLTLLGLAITIPFRAKQFSLGADSQIFLGALAAAAVSLYVPAPSFILLPLACLASAIVGFSCGLAPGLLKVRFGANEIVTSLMINLIAIQLYRLIIISFMNDPSAGFVATSFLPETALLSPLIERTNVTAMIFIALIASTFAWFLLMRTTVGFEIRVVGDSIPFARQAGIPIGKAVALSMAIGGGFAGLAGFHISNALLKRMPLDLNPGIGLEGIVVALLARNNPLAVPFSAFMYAYLKGGAQVMERSTDVPREMVLIIQAFIILFVVSDNMTASLALGWQRLRSKINTFLPAQS